MRANRLLPAQEVRISRSNLKNAPTQLTEKDTLISVCPSFFNHKEDHMVVGMITIGTCYGDADIPVELLGKGPRPGTAWG